MSKRDGGPAFPHIERPVGWDSRGGVQTIERWTQGGMSLRDYFAAAALSGGLEKEVENDMTCAMRAYEIADAMLKERDKP